MVDATFEEVLGLVEKLTKDEQRALLEHLKIKQSTQTRPPLELPVVDLGPWPEGVSLRREDWYEDD